MELSKEISDKLLYLYWNNETKSKYVALILKDKTVAPKFYNLEDEITVSLLVQDFEREYYPKEYQEKLNIRQKEYNRINELNRFNAAKVVESKDYTGYLFYNEEHYDDVSSFIESYLENYDEEIFVAREHLPKYLWGSKSLKINRPDFETISEQMCGDLTSWEESPVDTFKGVKEFKAALNKFYEDNKDSGWFEEDNKLAVLLTNEDFDYADKYWKENFKDDNN